MSYARTDMHMSGKSICRPHGSAGFTLFEVAISLGLLLIGVVSVMMVMPVAIKAQRMTRFQLYAAVKTQELIELTNWNLSAGSTGMDSESPHPWDCPAGYASHQVGVEPLAAQPTNGLVPMPPEIARRIDSDNDEIARIIADGGRLYYPQPRPNDGVYFVNAPASANVEMQQMVVAFRGFPQQPMSRDFTAKNWPYYYPYPSPPMQVMYSRNDNDPGAHPEWPEFESHQHFDVGQVKAYCWEPTFDQRSAAVFTGAVIGAGEVGWLPYITNTNVDTALAYAQAAAWYCQAQKLSNGQSVWDSLMIGKMVGLGSAANDFTGVPAGEEWKWVQGARFLAHAGLCLTRWSDHATLSGVGLTLPGVTIVDPALGVPVSSTDITVHEADILNLHETSLNLGMLFAASFPYDWAVPRPFQRSIHMDFPLIMADLFPGGSYPVLQGKLFDVTANPAGGISARAWRPLAARPIINIGRSHSFPSHAIGDVADPVYANGLWGDPAHFTLTRPFEAADRCRQIVYWAVDWKAYEDCETSPSAPVDASHYPLAAGYIGWDIDRRMQIPINESCTMNFMNPERMTTLSAPSLALATGADLYPNFLIPYQSPSNAPSAWQGARSNTTAHALFVGAYGADRNFNKRLDRGVLPKSVRLHATAIARFNFYNPRLPMNIR